MTTFPRSFSRPAAVDNTKPFAEAVMPHLCKLFPDRRDRRWPQPMATAQRAAVPAFVPGLAAE